jgi:hypothetical protein
MKNLLHKPLWRRSLLSLVILGFFVLIAVGSFQLDLLGLNIRVKKEYLGNNAYKETENHQYYDGYKTTTGQQDGHGRWHGLIKIDWVLDKPYTEEVRMEHGVRQGISTKTYHDGRKVEEHYFNGRKYELKKAAYSETGQSAFQLLGDRYPWFLFSLNGWGFDDNMVEACIDTIETLLGTYEFEMSEFESYYDDVLDMLGESPYDSLILLNSELSLLKGLDELKNSELRMALIDGYRANISTYDNIVVTYPGYLAAMNDSGITSEDFEQFLVALEDSMDNNGPFDPQDPFFTDSVDSRLFTALSGMLQELMSAPAMAGPVLKSAESLKLKTIRGMFPEIVSLAKEAGVKSTATEVALVVVSFMLPQMIEGDMIRRAVREAFVLKKGIIVVPGVATAFLEHTSATSARLQGYIFEDGGGAITARGIAWATSYNPKVSDNSTIPETQTGNFTVELTDLIYGLTYYARTFATNSAGTGYGNCISFVASSPTATIDVKTDDTRVTVYPNPASSLTTFNIRLNSAGNVTLAIFNLNGQSILLKDLGRLSMGENLVKLDLSGLSEGVYTCVIKNGTINAAERLVIAH